MPAPLSDHFAIMVQRLAALRVPRIVGEADGHDLRNVREHLIEIADAVDAYVQAAGREVAANAIGVDQEVFRQPMMLGLDGDVLCEITRAAEALDEEYQDVA